MDLTTALNIGIAISGAIGLFYIIATIAIVMMLLDIRSKLRTLNDNTIDKRLKGADSVCLLTQPSILSH